MAESLLSQILPHLNRSGVPDHTFPNAKGEYYAHCPYHHDEHPTNFSVSERGFKCFACGAKGSLRELAHKLDVRLHDCAVAGRERACTYSLAQYAQEKQLPETFLRSLGLRDERRCGFPAVRIAYRDAASREIAVRYRIAAKGDKFRWKQGARAMLYGLERLDRSTGHVHLVEGESDAQTLWFYREQALGIPGASTWKDEWAQHVRGLTVYVWQEPDEAGEALVRNIARSVPDVRVIVPPPGRKDISDCHLHGDGVPAMMAGLRAAARSYRAMEAAKAQAAIAEARQEAEELLRSPNILDRFLELCRGQGLVGEERTVKLLYLTLTSRLLERPVSVVVKGPSSGGKSFTVDVTLKAFPSSAYYALSGGSDHSLAYSEEPLEHRHLVLYEAAGMSSDIATFFMRTLLSEGHIRYETIETTRDGIRPRVIERTGPTGLIVTTTAAHLHPENETRMLSVTIRDTAQQTSSVLRALANRANGHARPPVDLTPWHALQEWLQLAGTHKVTIPYAPRLAELADNRAVRLRRDFESVLNLVRSHAVLHQETRERDPFGAIVATSDDYAAVFDLVIDIVSESVQASVKPEIREAVEAVRALDVPDGPPVTFKHVGEHLGIDKSSAKRRCEVAIREGYLVNKQERRSQPAMLCIGEPLPPDAQVLPSPVELMRPASPLATVQPCNRSGAETGPE